ncbi:MAG: MBL fold metallo-hydrolase [Schwartzia sp.]|nr:MBL fold metallo-hydrolase [Schwartzia sp. (in: firmicutes)]
MLRLLPFFLLLAFLITGCAGSFPFGAAGPETPPPAEPLTVKVLDVGQGEAILIRTPEQTVLLDTGDTSERQKLRAALNKEGVRTIDKLIVSHPHRDHLGGAETVFRYFQVKSVYDNGQITTSKLYRDYLKTIQRKDLPYHSLKDGDTLDFGGGVTFHVLGPTEAMLAESEAPGAKRDLNRNSLIARLTVGGFAMLLTADAGEEAEIGLLERHPAEALRCQVLKAGHHGSKTASSASFLRETAPEWAVISCGAANEYHLPHPSTRQRFEAQDIAFYRTDRNGTITVVTDGRTYTMTTERGAANDATEN